MLQSGLDRTTTLSLGNNFWTPIRETYLELGQMYLDHLEPRLFYNRYVPDLVEYVVAAMKVFADRKLA